MSPDTDVRSFLQRMAEEIDARPATQAETVARARRRRSIAQGAVVLLAVAFVSAIAVSWRTLPLTWSRPADHQERPIPLMHNGPLGTLGSNGINLVTADGAGAPVFPCRGCSMEAADWSADGTQLVFSSDCSSTCHPAKDLEAGLHVADLEHDTVRLVVSGNGIDDVAWSPDGTHIAYLRRPGSLILTGPDGSDRTLLVATEATGLSWSPDGSRLTYGDSSGVHVIGLDGGEPSTIDGVPGLSARQPAWSPDGSVIAYISAAGCEIRTVRPDGTDVALLMDLREDPGDCAWAGDLEWSPDGTQLAVMVDQEVTARSFETAVYLVDADGSDVRSVTDGWIEGWMTHVLWQPVP
jgi:Tol biopolymer transport system component